MTEFTKEDFRDAWKEDLMQLVDKKIDDGWRHGNNHKTVFERFTLDENDDEVSTGEYYLAFYRVSGDGEYHGIRELDFDFYRVYPHEEVVTITKTVWKTNPKD